jgi:hypothetical protein
MVSRSVLVVALVLSFAIVGATAARPPPEPLCGVCDDSLTDSATDHGVGLSTGKSHLSIQVAENGSARWRARVELRSGADALRKDDRRRRNIVRNSVDRSAMEGPDVRSAVENDTLVVTYRESDFARRSAGAVVVDSLTGPSLTVRADSIVVHAPPGYRPANRPTGDATTNGSAVVWSGGPDEIGFEPTYLAFVPTDALAASVTGLFATALAVGPELAAESLSIVFFTVLVLGGAAGFLTRRLDGTAQRNERVSLVVALGAAIAFLAVVFAGRNLTDGSRMALSLFVPTALFFGLGYHARRDRRAWGFVVTLSIAPFLGVFAMALFRTAGPVFGGGFADLFFDIGGVVALVVGVVAFFAGRNVAGNE